MPSAINETHILANALSNDQWSTSQGQNSPVAVVRLLTVTAVGVAFLAYIVFTWRWRIAVDTPVLHYAVFLMKHGLAPYGDITDNNMPGTYMTEALAMAVFGGSDLAWRVYEFMLMGLYLVCSACLTRTWHWTCGLFGAGVFLVIHGAEGPQLAVERELLIGVLLAVACVVFFEALNRQRPVLFVLVGFLSGTASSIKPTYLLLTLALFAIAAWQAWRRHISPGSFLLWGCLGLVFAFSADLCFLMHFHAVRGFAFILTEVLPAYHNIARMHWYVLIFASMPWFVAVLTFVAGSLAILPGVEPVVRARSMGDEHPRHDPHDSRWGTLVIVAAFGLISFFAQGKGYLYHRYVFLMFLLPILGIELFTALSKSGWPRWLALVSIGLVLFWLVPSKLLQTKVMVGQSSYELKLEQDLQQLGSTSALNGKIQCFDMVYGCLNALYHLDIVENSGFTGDMLLFPRVASAPSQFYQRRFWQLASSEPATILVLGNGIIGQPNSYAKLDRWPEFRAYLETSYDLVIQRDFPHDHYGHEDAKEVTRPLGADSYRIYVRKETPRRGERSAWQNRTATKDLSPYM